MSISFKNKKGLPTFEQTDFLQKIYSANKEDFPSTIKAASPNASFV